MPREGLTTELVNIITNDSPDAPYPSGQGVWRKAGGCPNWTGKVMVPRGETQLPSGKPIFEVRIIRESW